MTKNQKKFRWATPAIHCNNCGGAFNFNLKLTLTNDYKCDWCDSKFSSPDITDKIGLPGYTIDIIREQYGLPPLQ
jgi:DNA-directed RNA polymerase subunit RPC12/RpoP